MMRNFCFLERKYNIVVTPPVEVSKWTLPPPSLSFCNFSEEEKNMEKENRHLLLKQNMKQGKE